VAKRTSRTTLGRRKRPIAPEDLLCLRYVGGGDLTPDGAHYAFTVRAARADKRGYDSHLYVAATDGSWVRPYSYGKRGDAAPIFSPDGSSIVFTAKRGHHPGLHILRLDGGEARPVVERHAQFSEVSFSPDGKHLLCTYRPLDLPEEEQGKEFDPDKPIKSEAPVARHIDRLFYRLDGAGFLPTAEPQVWIFDIETGEGRALTSGKRGCGDASFSPDGKYVCYVSNTRREPDREPDYVDLFVVPARGGKARKIETPTGPIANPTFSPDGKTIAYFGHDDTDSPWYENDRVWVVPARGRGAARCVCPSFDKPAYDATISDSGGGFERLRPTWHPNGKSVYFVSCAHGTSHVYRVRVGARASTPERLTPEGIHLQSVSLSADRRTAVGVASTATRPAEVFRFDLGNGDATRITHLNDEWVSAHDVRVPKKVRVSSTEGAKIDTWILTPPKFSPRKKYPAIIQVHGGPMTQYGNTFFHEMQTMAAKGYVVAYSNPRGSLGYGREFSEAIKADWGNRDFVDVTAVTDYVEALPYVNPKRIGITGGSYGGYMTNWAVGHTHRYKAAVTQRSVVDLVPFYGSSDVGYLFRHTFGGDPWTHLEDYRRMSPLTYAPNIRTPLLIIHSEQDLRCNIEQGENLYATLKMLKRKTELVRFPEESHGLSRGGRPDRRIVRLNRILEWFDRHM
jgi:dipeptidyl aminopeptidase/acylaminoacyl peptidase